MGRHGTGVGRAVHGALEVLDFTTTDPSDIVREQAITEGLLGDLRTIDSLVRAGLETNSVRRAAITRHWRELYVAAPVNEDSDAPVIEGYIDLAVLESGSDGPGLIIVDYKTDAVADAVAEARKRGEAIRDAARTVPLAWLRQRRHHTRRPPKRRQVQHLHPRCLRQARPLSLIHI